MEVWSVFNYPLIGTQGPILYNDLHIHCEYSDVINSNLAEYRSSYRSTRPRSGPTHKIFSCRMFGVKCILHATGYDLSHCPACAGDVYICLLHHVACFDNSHFYILLK